MKWIKNIILLCCIIFTISCHKDEIEPIKPPTKTYIFENSENSIKNGQEIYFNLTSDGVYIFSLIDKSTNQVISKEKINGKVGENFIYIYTNSLKHQYLYLLLEDVTKNQIGKTSIIIEK